jgi:hypothetical protein
MIIITTESTRHMNPIKAQHDKKKSSIAVEKKSEMLRLATRRTNFETTGTTVGIRAV